MPRGEQWIKLVKSHNLGANKGAKKGKKKRAKHAKMRSAGAGRKREYQEQISKLKGWLQQERSFGHNISKRELLSEFCCYLVEHAKDLLSQADEMTGIKQHFDAGQGDSDEKGSRCSNGEEEEVDGWKHELWQELYRQACRMDISILHAEGAVTQAVCH